MKRSIWIIPALVIVTDLLVRSEWFIHYKPAQLIHYLISVCTTTSGLILAQLLIERAKGRTILYNSSLVLVSVYLVITVVASVSFFSINGFLPNYYTLEYFRTEPKSAMVLLRDSIHWVEVIVLVFSAGLLFFGLRKLTRLSSNVNSIRFLLLSACVFLSSFTYLTIRHKKYDQCYTMDTNFNAAFVRHLLELRKERKFEGRGLSFRHPVKLDHQQQTKCNVLVILSESLRRQNLEPYGYPKNTSPELKRFIKQFTSDLCVYNNAYTVSSTTMLAVPAMLSGVGPYQSPEIF